MLTILLLIHSMSHKLILNRNNMYVYIFYNIVQFLILSCTLYQTENNEHIFSENVASLNVLYIKQLLPLLTDTNDYHSSHVCQKLYILLHILFENGSFSI